MPTAMQSCLPTGRCSRVCSRRGARFAVGGPGELLAGINEAVCSVRRVCSRLVLGFCLCKAVSARPGVCVALAGGLGWAERAALLWGSVAGLLVAGCSKSPCWCKPCSQERGSYLLRSCSRENFLQCSRVITGFSWYKNNYRDFFYYSW